MSASMKRYGVIGLGSFGYYIAKGLYESGNEVIAVDMDRNKVQAMEQYCTDGIVMDATDKEKLKAIGLEETDAVVISTGEKISISILVCYYLKEIGVKRIVVKATDDDHANILRMLGATEIIHPEKDMAARIAPRSVQAEHSELRAPGERLQHHPGQAFRNLRGQDPRRSQPEKKIWRVRHRNQDQGLGKDAAGPPRRTTRFRRPTP